MFQKIKIYISAHKKMSIAVLIVALIAGYYTVKAFTNTSGETRYVTAKAQVGTIISSLSGSGQVSASDQIDIKSKVSGDILSLAAKAGQAVHAGDVLARIDAHDAEQALLSAQIAFQKLTQAADASTLLNAEDALTSAKDDLAQSYENGFSEVTSTFLDLPTITADLHDLFYSQSAFLNYDKVKLISQTAGDYQQTAAMQFDTTQASYDKNFVLYKSLNRTSDLDQIEALITTTYDTVRSLAETTKDAKDTVDYIQGISNTQDRGAAAATLSDLNSWTSTINSHVSALLSAKTAIQNDKRLIAEKQESLNKINAGTDPLDVQSEQLTVQQKKDALADYVIRAPFDGVIAKVDVTANNSVDSGTTIGTIITEQKIAQISLNEVDAAKVAIGQKATLTFDAIDGLSIAGTVSEVDLVGTVTQGVVNYTIKIAFDSGDDRVKPGMTVNAKIVTNIKQNVLTIPNSAVKSDAQGSYVERFNPPIAASTGNQGTASAVLPEQVSITTGLADDTSTEIVSGLAEGDQVVTRTIAPTTTTTAASPSILGGGNARPAAGATRAGAFTAR
jgi:HlyD family secretion protein